jgi:hypothetical protein
MKPRLLPGMIFRGTWDVKNAFVLILREIFADATIMDEQFRYVYAPDKITGEDDDEGGGKGTQIRIYKGFPAKVNSYPSIIVTTGSFDAHLTAMGEEGEEAGDGFKDGVLVARTFTGHFIIPVEIRVYSKASTDERDRLTDILLMMFRAVRRTLIHRFGFGFTDIQVTGEGQTEEPGSHLQLHTNSLVIACNTDYTWNLSVDQQLLINKILVKVDGELEKGSEVLEPLIGHQS